MAKCPKFNFRPEYIYNLKRKGYDYKPAPKMVKIRAWGRWVFCGTKSLETFQAQTVKRFQCQSAKVFNFDIPCFILLNKKYLAEDKSIR